MGLSPMEIVHPCPMVVRPGCAPRYAIFYHSHLVPVVAHGWFLRNYPCEWIKIKLN